MAHPDAGLLACGSGVSLPPLNGYVDGGLVVQTRLAVLQIARLPVILDAPASVNM